jgi:hypothetical protein
MQPMSCAKQTKKMSIQGKKIYSSVRVSSTVRPLTLLLLLFFDMFMKLSLFFTLPVRDDSDLSLFWLLIVSGRF